MTEPAIRMKEQAIRAAYTSTIDSIQAGDIGFYMDDWVYEETDDDGNPCGTKACLAGHAIAGNHDDLFFVLKHADRVTYDWGAIAARILTIEASAAKWLFDARDIHTADDAVFVLTKLRDEYTGTRTYANIMEVLRKLQHKQQATARKGERQ